MKHKFVNPVADDGDPNTTSPSNWNDDHVQPRTLSADMVLTANASMVIADDYEIASGISLELASDAVLEVT